MPYQQPPSSPPGLRSSQRSPFGSLRRPPRRLADPLLPVHFRQATPTAASPVLRRAFSEEEYAGGSAARIVRWREGLQEGGEDVDDGLQGDTESLAEESGVAPLPSLRRRPLPFLFSDADFPPLPTPLLPLDKHHEVLDPLEESFFSMAAVHDPSLFSSGSPIELGRPDGLAGPAGTLGPVGKGSTDASTTSESVLSGFEAAMLPKSMSSEELTGRMLHGTKAEASVGFQPRSASASPDACPPNRLSSSSSLASLVHLSSSISSSPASSPPGRSAVSPIDTGHSGHRSAASDSLARIHSTSPPSSSSPTRVRSPVSPLSSKQIFQRRHSSGLPETDSSTAPPLARSHSSGTSLDTLSRYLDAGRRSSLPHSEPATAQIVSAGPLRRRSPTTLDLRHFAAGSYSSLCTSFSHFSHLAHLHHAHAEPMTSWSSVKTVLVRFRPTSDAAVTVNSWVLGLQDLAAGGRRSWDPRLLSAAASVSSAPGGTVGDLDKGIWPIVQTTTGSPPSVEVKYRSGRRSVFSPEGMTQEQIMRAVLSPPA
ncbi:hypothetical protein JCM1841_006795 [Sporobolomyces salmonicolor]